MSEALAAAHREVANSMGKLAKLFTPECKLSFVMRHPSKPGCYMVVTDDDLDAVAATVLKSKERDAVTPR